MHAFLIIRLGESALTKKAHRNYAASRQVPQHESIYGWANRPKFSQVQAREGRQGHSGGGAARLQPGKWGTTPQRIVEHHICQPRQGVRQLPQLRAAYSAASYIYTPPH
jgi:hypothetical protein